MNAKKCKALRKTIRRVVANWPARSTTTSLGREVKVPKLHLQLDGTTLVTHEFFRITGTTRLDTQTQRGLYQRCKSMGKANESFFLG